VKEDETRQQLLGELTALRQRLAELEVTEAERQQAEEALERRVAELSALSAMATIVNESVEVDEILNRAMDEALRQVGVEAAAIMLLDGPSTALRQAQGDSSGRGQAGGLVMAAHRGISDEFVQAFSRMKLGEGLSGQVAQTGQPAVLSDLAKYPEARRSYLEAEKIRSAAVVPLLGRSAVIGTMNLATASPEFFDAEGLDLLVALGQQIAVGVEKAHLYQETRTWAAELERRVGERTAEVAKANEALKAEVVERKGAVESLRESEHLLRMIADNVPALVSYMDQDRCYRFVNQRYAENFDKQIEAMIGRPYREIVGEVYYQATLNNVNAAFTGQPLSYETPIDLPEIGTHWLIATYTPDMDEQGNVKGIFVVGYDITERKRAEEQITHLNAVLRAIRNVNQLIVREENRDRLLPGVCESLIETRGYYNAWIALVDESGALVAAAEAGLGQSFVPLVEQLKRGQPTYCTQTALAQADVLPIEDPSSTCSGCPLSSGHSDGGGAMAVRLEHSGKVYGLLAVSTSAELVADREERALFEEVARDIAVALHSMELEEQRKQAEEALRRSEKRFRALIENSADAISLIDATGTVLYNSPPYRRLLGYSEEERRGRNTFELVHPDDRERLLGLFARILQKPDQVVVPPTRIRHADGSWHWIEGVATNLLAEPSVQAIVVNFRDITERRQAEEALRESEDKFKYVFDHSIVGKSITLPSGKMSVNEAFCEMLGYTAEELQSQRWQDITHPDDIELTQGAIGPVLAGEKGSVRFTKRYVRKDGSIVWADASTFLRRDKEGKPLYFMTTVTDITERKQAEEELKNYQDQLEGLVEERTRELREAQEQLIRQEKLAVLGQLAGGVGHELRNPLGAIKNAAYYLNMVLEDPDPETREMLEVLDKEVGTAERIIASLLDYARARPPTVRRVDLNDVVRETLSRTPLPAAPNIEVSLQLDEDLPPILADPDQLSQVLGNILGNAIQAMPDGGHLTVRTAQEGPDWVTVSVADTGAGISEENLSKIFEPLFTTKAKGIGLGLAVVKTLVEGHGGTIGVESRVGAGSTFTVRLPLGVSAAVEGEGA
jgi:PAS domain S-box-containing protein